MARIDSVVDNVILHPGLLSRSACPSPQLLGRSLLQKVHRCVPQRGLPSVQEYTPHPSPLTVGQPTSCDRMMQGNEGPVPCPQFRTFLKGYHRSGAFGGIRWDLNGNLTASQLHHLSNLAFLTSLRVYLPRAFFSKPSRYNSEFLSLVPGSPPKMHGVYQTRGQATEARAEPRGRDARDRDSKTPVLCVPVWEELCHRPDSENGHSPFGYQEGQCPECFNLL